MSYISGHRSLPVHVIFPEPFLRKKTRACAGNWEDSLRQSTRERWQFPCLPLPCLVFTSKTTEKAHIIYSDKEENGGPKGHLNKQLCNCGVAQQAGRGKQLFEGLLRGTLMTMTLSHRHRESLLMSFIWIFSKSSHPNMLMAVKSCPINLHIIGKSALWNVKALLCYEILHMQVLWKPLMKWLQHLGVGGISPSSLESQET